MGGKSSGAGQHLYLLAAGLMLVAGCGLFAGAPPPSPAPPPITEPPPEPVVPPIVAEPKVETPPAQPPEQREASEHLQLAQNFLAKGDYEASLRESRRVLAVAKEQPPADAAVFNMGLVYANPKNPKRDNKQAIGFFSRLIKSYPDSPWVEQAKIWVAVLDGVEKLKQVDLDIEEKKRDRLR